MTFDVDPQQPGRHQLTKDGTPFVLGEFAADAERRQPIVTELPDAFVCGPGQHVDEMGGAESLAGSIDAGQGFLGRHGAVEALHRVQAGVAIAAGFARIAEIIERPPGGDTAWSRNSRAGHRACDVPAASGRRRRRT